MHEVCIRFGDVDGATVVLDRRRGLRLLHNDVKLYNSASSNGTVVMAAVRQTVARQAAQKVVEPPQNPRRNAVLKTARDAGLLAGESSRIAGRIRKPLIDAARARSGVKSDTELLEYALACVALEDDFGQRLLARRGRVSKDIDLEF